MEIAQLALPSGDEPLVLARPANGACQAFRRFDEAEDWRCFIGSLAIHPAIPDSVAVIIVSGAASLLPASTANASAYSAQVARL